MRILYLTQWFHPEPNIVKGAAFVRGLQAPGHEVTVVTGLPNYPAGRIYPGYKLHLFQTELIDGVQVVRLPLYPDHGESALGRSLNFLSFFLSALIYCLFRRRAFDLAYVYHPPITVGLAAALAGLLRPMPLVLDVQDLWPDTIAVAGMRGCRPLAALLNPLCSFVYRRSKAIIAQSPGMREALIERGVAADKVTTICNWADVGEAETPATRTVSGSPLSIVYAGNLGRAQALHTVVDAAAILEGSRRPIRIMLYGDGVDAARLKSQIADRGLRSISVEPPRSRDAIIEVLAAADALLIHLADEPLFRVTIPSKCQFYLALGRPIVAGIAGDGADILSQSGSALVVPPSNGTELAAALMAMADTPLADRERMGASGRRYYENHFAFDLAMKRTLTLIESVGPVQAPSTVPAAA